MKKTLINVAAILSFLSMVSSIAAEPSAQGSTDRNRARPTFDDLITRNPSRVPYRLVAVTPPYIWLQMETSHENGSGPIYVCKYKPDRPWEISERCDQVEYSVSKEDFGK